MFCRGLFSKGGGVIRAPYLLLFLFVKTIYYELFSPTRAALPRRGVIQEKRQRNQHNNFGIKEHDISYLDATNEISLTMFSNFSLSLSIWRPWSFFSLEPLLTLETAWRPSRHVDSLSFIPFLSCPLFLSLFSFFSSFFFSLSLFLSFPLFLFSFGNPFVTSGGPGPQSPPRYASAHGVVYLEPKFFSIFF